MVFLISLLNKVSDIELFSAAWAISLSQYITNEGEALGFTILLFPVMSIHTGLSDLITDTEDELPQLEVDWDGEQSTGSDGLGVWFCSLPWVLFGGV